MSASRATLGAATDDRKARLAKLKTLKRKQPADEIVAPEFERSASPPPEADVATRLLSGRNYDAETRGPKLGFEAPPTLGMEGPTLEQQAALVEEETRKAAAEDARDDQGIDLFKLQPKKPNWDLKRDLEKKLEVLNVRTDNAIARLVRERIANAQAAAKQTTQPMTSDGDGESAEAAGVDGVALVEGLRVREREEEEERREREEEGEAEDLA
ncbi:cwf18 pre-mRNA splicing factor-domain-containing protein [Nemania serpens]|nr:cwf18 pre-mRNA splicing factor-domain-containing protein [Nemania serpens]